MNSKLICIAVFLLCAVVLSSAVGYSPCHGCHQYAKCVRRLFSFKCVCNYGYYGNGKTCAKIDACHRRPYPCSKHATCVEEHYKPVCICKPGFVGNGKVCRYDVCYQRKCGEYAVCKPAFLGGYKCVCQKGYYKKGRYCVSNNSCRHRCGIYKHGLACQCNKHCNYYKNCCKDYSQSCSARRHYG